MADNTVSIACDICGSAAEPFGRQRVLGRHEAVYLRCTNCGFLQVDNPTWLAEAYSSAVADVDIGTIQRMTVHAKLVKIVLHVFLKADGRYLDYGAGYGAFVRRMRDLGYNFRWFDLHCDNIFAKGFAAGPDEHFDVLTAFEVFEHLPHPTAEIATLAERADHLIFSTSLIGQRPPPLDEWPYYAPETGQHIAFYTHRSLELLAGRLGLHFCSNGSDFHLLSRAPVSPRLFSAAVHPRVSRFIHPLLSRPTLLYKDFHQGRQAALEARHPSEQPLAAGR